MPPLRRYLRISRYSVLEVRVYLDTPADLHRWLIREPSPALPRIISAVRPLVLPKLQEENAQAKKGKRKGWKDTVVEEDFEVAVFLTETSSRHTILKKEKRAKSEKMRLGTLGGKMTGSREAPVEVGEDAPGLRREESDDAGIALSDLPPAASKRESEERLFLSDDENDENDRGLRKGTAGRAQGERKVDDKKKLALDTTYDGFSIYGRILCLVVKRRNNAKGKEPVGGARPAMMEEWISSTQEGAGAMMDE